MLRTAAYKLTAQHTDLRQNERLACVGSTSELGEWELDGAREMKRASEGMWTASLQLEEDADVHYKYVVLTEPEVEHKIEGFRELNIGDDAPPSFTVVDSFSDSVRSLTGILPASEIASKAVGKCRFELMVDEIETVAQVQVVGAHPSLGSWREEHGIPLEKEAGTNLWVGTAELPLDENVEYKFIVWREAMQDASGKKSRELHIPADASKIHMSDKINQAKPVSSDTTPAKRSAASHLSCLCKFDVEVDGAAEGTSVSLVGSHEFLGEWQTGSAVPMFRTRENIFSASMHLPVNTDLQYKYLVKLPPVWDNVVRHVSLAGDLTVARETMHRHARQSTRAMPPLSVHSLEEGDGVPANSKPGTRVCTFRLEQPAGFSDSIGVIGDAAALGNWNASHCLPMEAHTENGKVVFTASTSLEAGTRVNYKYVILHAPRWESRTGNRVIMPLPVDNWQGARRDNVRLVRCVRDIVGTGNAKHSLLEPASETADADSPAIAHDGNEVEVVNDECYLEAVDPSLCGTCLFKVDVEVKGLARGDSVWICGDDEALGSWQEGRGVKLVGSPHVSGGASHIWSAVVRLPTGKQVAYKYCVAYKDDSVRDSRWEMGTKRQLVTPANMRGSVFDRFESPLPLRSATDDDDEAPESEMESAETQTPAEFERLAAQISELRTKYETECTLVRRLEKENARLQAKQQDLNARAQPRLSSDTHRDAVERQASPEPEKTATLICNHWHPPAYRRETTPEWVQELGAEDALKQEAATLKVQQYQAVVLQQTKEHFTPQLHRKLQPQHYRLQTTTPPPNQQHNDNLDESSVTSTPGPATSQQSLPMSATQQSPQKSLAALAPPLSLSSQHLAPLQAQQQTLQVEDEHKKKLLRAVFVVEVHGLAHGDSIYLCGSHSALGSWDPDQGVPLLCITDGTSECGVWRCEVMLPGGQEHGYKYVVRGADHSRDRWEPGNDRRLHTLHGISCDKQRVDDELVDTPHLCPGHDSKLPVSRSRSSGMIVKTGMAHKEGTQEGGHITELDARKIKNAHKARMEKMEVKSVLEETDDFLSSQKTQSVNGHQSEQIISRNRMYKEHCQSVLSETSDEHTRTQVMNRLSALETAFNYASSTSSATASNAGLASLENDAMFNDPKDSPFRIKESRRAHLDMPGSPSLLQEGQPKPHMKALHAGQPLHMKALQHAWSWQHDQERQQMVIKNSTPVSNSNAAQDKMQLTACQLQQQLQPLSHVQGTMVGEMPHALGTTVGEKTGSGEGRRLKEVHYSSQGSSFMSQSTTTTTTTRVVYKQLAT